MESSQRGTLSFFLRRSASAVGFAIALAAQVAAQDLPELVAFNTSRGRALGFATVAILVLTFAWGVREAWLRRDALHPIIQLLTRRRWLFAAAALLWIFATVHPVHLERLPRTDVYRVATSFLAPLSGLVLTVAAALWLSRLRRRRPWPPIPALMIAAAALLAGAALIGAFVLEHAPHIPDEIAYLFDARSLASGRRMALAPPVEAAFPPPQWIEVKPDGAHGVLPIGWPLLLALGTLAGIPWLVNPVIAGCTAIAAARLCGGTANGGDGARRATAWLLAVSPFVLFLGGSFMAHSAAMLWTALALSAYLAHRERPTLASAIILPIAGGMLLLTRPIDAGAMLAAVLVHAWFFRGSRTHGATLLLLLVGLAAGSALSLLDNARLTGSALVPPVNRYFDNHFHPGANRLGFGPDVGLTWDFSPAGHSIPEAVWNLRLNLEQMNRHFLGWPSGSLLLALIFLLGSRKTRGEKLLLAHAASTIVLYGLYWYHGVAFGPRFLATLAPALAVFTWRGASEVRSWLARHRLDEECLGAGIAFSIASALALYVPIKALAEYRDLRGTDGTLLRAATALPPPALIFVDGPRWPDYDGLYFLNSPDYRGPRVIALHRGVELDGQVLAAYPDRPACILRRGQVVQPFGSIRSAQGSRTSR